MTQTNSSSLIANVLTAKRYEVADIFANALYLSPRWKSTLDAGKDNWDTFLEEEFFAYADYLIRYFQSNDDTYKNLFMGEKLKSLYDADLNAKARHALARSIEAHEQSALQLLLQSDLGSHWDTFINELKDINNIIASETPNQLHIAFVGDCLFLDILPFIVGPLIKEGISIHASYIASKNPIDTRDELKKLSSQKVDLIFFSPFTYDFSPNLVITQRLENALLSENKVIEKIAPSWNEAEKTIHVIADLFDCPTYVHNAAFIIRDENACKRFIKHKGTSRIRHVAKKWIHEKVHDCLEAINQQSFRHLFLFDELKQLESISEQSAGALLYNSKLQHPSVLGMAFAKPYIDIIYANAKLRKKKLVVCDLDNTLWDGVIGEGAVAHFHDRQTILKGLREKGIVLAINSKNDPKNVHWTNATLTEADFVYEAINWQPKVQNMSRIPDELNLKINSFIFIDDRADELELMKEAYPDVLCLNATEPKTWNRLAIWENTLEDDQEMDRTLMYQQREKRKEFVKEEVTSDEDRLAMFSSLGLHLIIKRPELNEVKRVTELINRTNQFNLEGARVSLSDMNNWFNDKDYIMLSGRTSDRFGDMGVTCVTVGKLTGNEFRVIAFVLSCRVFGYQFEHSVMSYLKTLAKKAGATTMKAKYIATAVNAPCKDFLKDNGFIENGEFSCFDLSQDIQPDAAWITVETDVNAS
jgi:FkbH-like protein